MGNQNSLTRQSFIRTMAGSGLGLLAWIWYRLGDDKPGQNRATEYSHAEIPAGISFYGKYYLYRRENTVLAFSATCTHAGCRLSVTTSETIHCGCHGSQFDALTGKPLKGPAIHPLEKLECNYNAESSMWMVKFKSAENSEI